MAHSYLYCPDCGERIDTKRRYRKVGYWRAHPKCRVFCGICGGEIEEPPIGQPHLVVAWLDRPAHVGCRDTEREALTVREAEV